MRCAGVAPSIIAANAADLDAYEGLPSLRDRLRLDERRVEAMAVGLEEIAALPDPLGHVLAEWTRPNGLRFQRISTPIGVIGMVYESRPNVGADAAGICLKSGNAVILRGGSDSFHSAGAIHAAIGEGLRAAGLPEAAVQIAPGRDRAFVAAMLGASGLIDLIIPRGGKGLVTRVQAEARVPVLAHAEGLNHTYIHAAADRAMARRIMLNAKMRRTDVCGATETLLIDAAIAPGLLPSIIGDLRALGCEFRADAAAQAIIAGLPPATEADFHTEWLDRVLAIRVVAGVDEAIAHIATYGSEHTEAIITEDAAVAEYFLNATVQRRRPVECIHPVLRWRRIWIRCRNRHCDGAHSGTRAGGRRTAHHLPLSGPRHGSGAALTHLQLGGPADPLPRRGDRRRMRIGILGGSFNPAHAGHLHVARVARRRFGLDQVWLMVSPGNPLKPSRGMAPFAERLASARLIADGRHILATRIEANIGTRYTHDTLDRLHQLFPLADFVWLMGADNLEDLSRWQRWRAIAAKTALGVLPRPEHNMGALAGRAAHRLRGHRLPARQATLLATARTPAWIFLPTAQNALSATALRAAKLGAAKTGAEKRPTPRRATNGEGQ